MPNRFHPPPIEDPQSILDAIDEKIQFWKDERSSVCYINHQIAGTINDFIKTLKEIRRSINVQS